MVDETGSFDITPLRYVRSAETLTSTCEVMNYIQSESFVMLKVCCLSAVQFSYLQGFTVLETQFQRKQLPPEIADVGQP